MVLGKAVGATVAVQVLNFEVGSSNPMLSTSGQAQIPQLALLTGFKVVHAMFQPQMQVGYGPWHCFGPPSGLLICLEPPVIGP